jgi:hypothetical protein
MGWGSGFLALAFRSPAPVNPLTYDIRTSSLTLRPYSMGSTA